MTGGHIRNRRALKSKTTNNTSITGIFDIGEKEYIYKMTQSYLKIFIVNVNESNKSCTVISLNYISQYY